MEIKAASRGFSLFLILVCAVVACGCALLLIALLSRGSTTDLTSVLATILIALALAAVTGWMIYCIRLWVQVDGQRPTFRISVEPGVLTVTRGRDAITIRSSDVVAYYLYNNKVRVVLRDPTSPRSLAPFAELKGDRLMIWHNRIDRRVHVATWLHTFDRDFNVKNRTSLGMIAQVLGYGLS